MNTETKEVEESRRKEEIDFWTKILSWFLDEVERARDEAERIGGKNSTLVLQGEYDKWNYNLQVNLEMVRSGKFTDIPSDAMEKLKTQTESLIAQYVRIIDTAHKA